jgi:predicted Zn-ribbon and HTH transcriptional regulator
MAQIIRARGEAYRRSHVLKPHQLKAMSAIARCRTDALGGHVDSCGSCGYTAISYNSCRNRHCPKCQALAQARWIEGRLPRILPTHYFHVVFTLPAALRPIALRAPEALYDLLFASASATLLELGRDPQRLGAQLGFTAVLHTWTRRLELHPHLHCVVSGGGLTADGSRWISVKGKDRFLFPVRVLSRLFRGKFIAGLVRLFEAGKLGFDPTNELERSVFDRLRARLYGHDWNVYAKRPFKGAEHVYQYLGRYTHRVGLSNHRLREITDNTVTFGTKDGGVVTLSHEQFLDRFLLHVLPPRFVKIRHFGLMSSSNATTKLESARALLEAAGAQSLEQPLPRDGDWFDQYERLTGTDLRECPRCKRPLSRFDLRSPQGIAAVSRAGKGPDP